MPFEKGHKHGKGRIKGSENKLTKEAREIFIDTLEGQVPNIEEAFSKVLADSPAKYLDLFAKYAQYFVPKKTESDVRHELSESFNFNEVIEKLRGDQ